MAKPRVNKTAKPRAIVKEVTVPVIGGEYELVDIAPIKVNTGFGNYNLAELTSQEADFLISKGFKFIRKKG